jgi:GT2 family glycosyltransferase
MLKDLLLGLAAQTFPAERFEVIILDNQSQEDVESVVCNAAATARFDLRFERMEQDRGPVPARNRGVRMARGTIVAFTDSDCRPAPSWLETGLRHFSDPHVALVSGPIACKPEQSPTFFYKARETQSEHPTYPAANAFYRRDLFLLFRGFDETLSLKDFLGRAMECADTDLAWRIRKAGWLNRFEPKALVYHEIEPLSVFAWLMEPTKLILLPRLLRLHPELSSELLRWNVLFYRGTVWVYVAAAVIVLMLLLDWRSLWIPAAAALVITFCRARTLSPSALAQALWETSMHFARMVVLAATLVTGSLLYRRLVL